MLTPSYKTNTVFSGTKKIKTKKKYSYILAIAKWNKGAEKNACGGVWCAVRAGLCWGRKELPWRNCSHLAGIGVCWALRSTNSEPEKKKWQC